MTPCARYECRPWAMYIISPLFLLITAPEAARAQRAGFSLHGNVP